VSRADSPLRDRVIFCIGARRSGTFLAQRMIAAHPAVSAVPSESHLISHGIAPLLERFHHGARSSAQVGSVYADRDLLLDALRDFCDAIFGQFLEPGTTHVLERTPLHALHASLIAELYPDAGVVHVIRDGRDVALSLTRRSWGPDSIEDGAREWVDCVRRGREASGMERYVEVRYEQLLADPGPSIQRVWEHLGLERSDDSLDAALAEQGLERNVEPGDTIGTEKWRRAYSRSDLRAFDRVAGKMLHELGYTAEAEPETHGGSALGRVARRVRGVVGLREWRRRRAASQVEEGVWSAMILDRLLTAAREGREEGILELLDPSPEAVLVGPDGELRTASGESARRLLADAITRDPALRGRQLASEVLPGRPTTAAALKLELPDGRIAQRVVAVDVRDRLVKRVIVELTELP
jgi:hypothetical protein